MKKILLIAIMAIFTTGAFAGVNKGKAKLTKSKNKTTTSKVVECTPSITKAFHYTDDCDWWDSWYTVDYVETTIVTCDGNGNSVSNCYHWDQAQSLICS